MITIISLSNLKNLQVILNKIKIGLSQVPRYKKEMRNVTCYLSRKLTYLKTKLKTIVLQCIDSVLFPSNRGHCIAHCLKLKVK